MNTILRAFSIVIAIASLTACSITPGIPGLKTSASRNATPQKEGVDYKVVLINAKTISNQKPFDYAAYVRSKIQRSSLYKSDQRVNSNNSAISSNTRYVNNQKTNVSSNSFRKENISQKSTNAPTSLSASIGHKGISSSDYKANYQYYIGKGDVLNITVWDHPELTTPSKNNSHGGHLVGSDGHFYFPYSGKIKALGKTVGSIRNELESKLGSFITKPQVSVSIAKHRSQRIYTSGALARPTTLIIDDTPTTVRDSISKSGGLIPKQYTGYATLARNGKNISIDLNRMLKLNDNSQNFILRNGDRLHIVERSELAEFNRKLNLDVRKENTLNSVRLRNEIKNLQSLSPVQLKYELNKQRAIARLKQEIARDLRAEQAKVFVMGEVHKPGSVTYQVEDGMTLAEAVNDAGSFKEETVDPKGIFVIRKEGINDKIPTVYQLPLSSVQSMFLAEQFNIRPRDILYVTATPSIRWNRLLAQILPSLALYRSTR